jgi:hypothetical protein
MTAPRKSAKAPASKPKSLGKREMRAFLENCSRENLIDQVMGLFAEIDQVREHYHTRVRGEDKEIRAKYKARIAREFESNGYRLPPLGVSAAKRAVAEYGKVAASVQGIADVMLYYVEAGLWPIEEFGITDHPSLLGSVLRMYRDALIHVRKHGLDRDFVTRSYAIAERGRKTGLGYEFREIHDLIYGDPSDH